MANWEVVIEGRQGQNDMLNVFHYQSSGVEPPDWDAAATVIRGHLADHIAPLANPTVTWLGITVREDIPGGVGTFFGFGAGTLAGTQGAGDQLNVLAALIRKHSGGLVKPTLGWWFQGGITAGGLNNVGVWESGPQTALEDYAEDIRILNISGPTTLTMVIKARNPTAPNTQAYSTVNAVSVAATPRTMRSRFPGSGS